MRYLVEGQYISSIVTAFDKEGAAFEAISEGNMQMRSGSVEVKVSEIEEEATSIIVKVKLTI